MTEQTDKMNYCCDCGWAVKRGLFFKKWYCTCPEILKKNLDTVLCIVDTKRTECRKLREDMFGDHFEFLPCPNYKGELRHHPAIPPMKNPLPCPPLPERVEKAMEEHDAAYLMNQKQRELEAENNRLRKLITEIREFLIEGAIPGKVCLKQECIREIYTIANEEDQKRRAGE